jgi:hypothetical protein
MVWRIPAARMKKRKEHVIPLPRQAVEMLERFTGSQVAMCIFSPIVVSIKIEHKE